MNLLKDLIFTQSVSGYETCLRDYLIKYFRQKGLETVKDISGSLKVLKLARQNAPTLVIDAHYDTIGFILKRITESGYLEVSEVGSLDLEALYGSEVIIHGEKNLLGIVAVKPPHLDNLLDDTSNVPFLIDCGFSKNELEKMVEIGTPISLKPVCQKLMEEKIVGTHLDNKIGVYAAIKIFEELELKNINLCLCLTSREEIGLQGASYFSNTLEPNLVIVIDTTHGETPTNLDLPVFKLGQGPTIMRGPILNESWFQKYYKFYIKNGLNIQIEAEGGFTGTNAWKYYIGNKGTSVIMLSVPLKYMHTPIEMVSLKDVNNLITGTSKFLENLDISRDLESVMS